MCGILVTYGDGQVFHHRLLRTLKKRGPDAIGFWTDGRLNLGATRLSILGLDERGVGPFENETHVLTYNGEIYNFIELNERLEAEGIQTSGANDSETLLQLWTRWGERILPDLDGFFAFAVYDKREKKLTLVRDQLGIKPLYYWLSKDMFCASSLISTLLQVSGTTPELDYHALSEYVRYQFTFEDKTFLRSVKKVLPGHIIEFDTQSHEMVTRRYEDIFNPKGQTTEIADDAWIRDARELLVRCCLASTISDTSFTTFCSGGIDSSFITRITKPEVAYHCNFSDPDCNETFFAQQAVQETGSRLFVVNAQEEFDLVARLKSIVEDFDEPTIGSVILPLDDLLAQVKRRYKVILTGTGGDELFGGYVRYHLAMGYCPQDSYRGLFARMQSLTSPADRFELAHRKGDASLYRFYLPEVEETFKHAYEECSVAGDELRRMLTFDRRYFLSGLLNIDDKMCGRHSLESRPSFLHQKFVRHVQMLDSSELFRNTQLKSVLRRLADGVLPKSIVQRTDKMGFTTPIGTFINKSSHLIREQLTESRFRHLYDLRRMNLTAETKFSREVFGLLVLDLWLHRYAAVTTL